MTRFRIQVPAALSMVVLSIPLLVSFNGPAEAIMNNCSGACLTGMLACLDWCDAHNRTSHNIAVCKYKCDVYWNSGKNPQSIGRSDPSNPPPKPGPGREEDPPTTVGPPTRKPRPVQPVKPVGVSNPNNPNSGNGGPVILLREHNDSGGQGRRH
jgi:hypothetical protein